jgi:hypothetical protein
MNTNYSYFYSSRNRLASFRLFQNSSEKFASDYVKLVHTYLYGARGSVVG